MASSFNFQTVPQIQVEPGAAARLGDLMRPHNFKRVFMVTDGGLMKLGILESALASLNSAGISVQIFQDVVADPPEAVVSAALAKARDFETDLVIGFGGGSSMDVAKLIAVLFAGKQDLADIYGIGNVKGSRLPLWQIPTTAGTGSEVTPISIITTGETTKMGVVSPQLYADFALLDAELTVGLPPHVTAATGIDAMVHAIEAFTSKIKKNAYSDALAKAALRHLAQNITRAVENGGDIEARSGMLFGAMLAGQAFANAPVAAVHALAYPLGGHYHISHGLSNSLILPHVIRFNAPEASALYAELAAEVFSNMNTAASDLDQSLDFAERLYELAGNLGLPTTLKACEVKENDLAMLAEDSMKQTRLLVNNPREVKLDDALQIYEAAYG